MKPEVPALAQTRVAPTWSVIVMTVLLKVDWMWATPNPISLRAFFLALALGGMCDGPPYFFVSLVFLIRWPRTPL
ncbi:MAG: hypothetical protein ACXWHI_08780, partial [Candidatus Aminicenantales bacterium]